MKKTRKFLLGTLGSLCIAIIANAMVTKYSAFLVNEPGLASNKTYPLPLDSYGIDYLSFTSVASSVTFAASTFTDGQLSTGTITVTANTGLSAVSASDFLTVITTSNFSSTATLTVNGVLLTNGIQWFSDFTTTSTAISIRNAIASYVPNVQVSTGLNSTVYSTATVSGSYGNNMTFVTNVSTAFISFNTYTSSTPTSASSQFSGGKDSATISINGFFVSFTPGATSSATALSIAQGINSNTSLNKLVVSSVPDAGTIVFATSTQVGSNVNYVMTSSTDSSLTIGGSTKTVTGLGGASIGQMWGGAASALPILSPSTTAVSISIPNHGWTQALAVLLSTTGTNTITPLINQTTYYVIPLSANGISLSFTSTGAVAGLAVVFTSSQTKTTTDSFTLTPLGISGVPSYKWQVSNDGTNWYDYLTTQGNVAVSSVSLNTFNSTGTANVWDFGPVDYAFIRLNVVAPTQGAIRIQVVGNGKNTNN